jgi:predicted nucleic acid-binding protein
VLTDDRAARAEAQRRSIAISGSIGCLVLSVERGHASLDHANHLLAQMVAYGYQAPLSDLAVLVKPDRLI